MATTKTILKAAFIVGTLDITAACLQVYLRTGQPSVKPVLLFVASGLLGKTAYNNGDIMMLVGLLVHYCVATAFTFFFFLVVARFSFARHQRLLTGILYGAFVWVVMNLLVLPLTGAAPLQRTFSRVATGMGILIVCIGIPLAFLANRENAHNQKTNASRNLT